MVRAACVRRCSDTTFCAPWPALRCTEGVPPFVRHRRGGVETDAQVSRAGVRATPPLCDPSTSPPMPIRFRSLACVLLFPDASKPTVTVNITYLVGSRHEGYGETGMAHLPEHLLFKGTPMHKDTP